MLKLLTVALALGCASGYVNYAEYWQKYSASIDGKIVGGVDAELGEFPYIVSVQKNGQHNCGGSIVNENFVLTAAHCVYGLEHTPSIFKVLYGTVELSDNSNIIQVIKVIRHEKYIHSGKYPNDIALLELQTPIPFDSTVGPIPLASGELADETSANLAGWGYSYTGGKVMNHLQKVTISVFQDDYCAEKESYYDARYHMCAGAPGGGKGQCSGDSGGPLVADGEQVGVVSWSVKPCASPAHPGVFTKVANYVEWIGDKTSQPPAYEFYWFDWEK